MKAIVVYESLWGNTAADRAGDRRGDRTRRRALSTAEATAEDAAGADLIVAGAPLLGFSLPTEAMRDGIRTNPGDTPTRRPLGAADALVARGVPMGSGCCAGFETRIWWSPGSAAKKIASGLEAPATAPVASRASSS